MAPKMTPGIFIKLFINKNPLYAQANRGRKFSVKKRYSLRSVSPVEKE